MDCERGFNTNDRANHTCQGNRCRACGRFDCQDYVRGTRPSDYCTLCHRKFYGGYCKRHHEVTKQCQSIKTCLKCQAEYTVVPNRRHQCGHAKCPVCRAWVPIQDHKCYIQLVVEDEEPEPTEEGEVAWWRHALPCLFTPILKPRRMRKECLWLICCVIRPAKKQPSMCRTGRTVPYSFCTIWMISPRSRTGMTSGRSSWCFTIWKASTACLFCTNCTSNNARWQTNWRWGPKSCLSRADPSNSLTRCVSCPCHSRPFQAPSIWRN